METLALRTMPAMGPVERMIIRAFSSAVVFVILTAAVAWTMAYYRKQGRAKATTIDGAMILQNSKGYRMTMIGCLVFAGIMFIGVFVFVIFVMDDVGTPYRVFMSVLVTFVFAMLPLAYQETVGVTVIITEDGVAVERSFRRQVLGYGQIKMTRVEKDHFVLHLVDGNQVCLPKSLVGWNDGATEIEKRRIACQSK